MKRRARGFTVVEVLVACALIALVLGALFGFFSVTRRMNDAARGSASVTSALLIEETIASDMRMLGIDPRRAQLFDIAAGGISFYRTAFVGPAIHLRPVRYQLRRTRAGNAQLVRTELIAGKPVDSNLDGILSAIAFSTTKDRAAQINYLKVSMTVLPEDLPPGPTAQARSVTQVLLARLPVPVQVVNPELEPTSRLLPEADLLPLDTVK